RADGFRLVETVETGRAGLAVAGRHQGARPARLAYRMLGDVMEASRRNIRHPWRRHRSRVSASRERDRAVALCFSYTADGELLGTQRLSSGRRREDGEVARQLRHHPRFAEGLAGRGVAISDADDSLPATA